MIDWVVILHIVVWALAGLWVVNGLWLTKARVRFRLSSLEKLSLLLVCCLSVSILFSEGFALTAFKVYQLLISILFASVFTRCYGIKACLEGILVGSAILCAADAVAAFVAPDMVMGLGDFGSLRFRGELIAPTGTVGPLALVLFVSSDRKWSRLAVAAGITLFGSVLLFSLTRTSYLAVVAFLLFALWKAPEIKLLKRVVRWAGLVIPLAVVGGALAQLEEYRPAGSLWTLSDRVGLWTYLVETMWTKSPWFGLGYFSGSRIYGQEYSPLLGGAHSVFVEVLSGGGVVSFTVFLLLWFSLLFYVFRLLRRSLTPTSFAVIGLLVVTFPLAFIGSELQAEPAGFTFWIIVASVPLLCQQQAGAEPRSCSQFAMDAGRATLPRPI